MRFGLLDPLVARRKDAARRINQHFDGGGPASTWAEIEAIALGVGGGVSERIDAIIARGLARQAALDAVQVARDIDAVARAVFDAGIAESEGAVTPIGARDVATGD
jgi:hypothetical protein